MTEVWSRGYRSGTCDGIRWVIDRMRAGRDLAQIMDDARRKFQAVDDNIARYWRGELARYLSDGIGRDALADEFNDKR